jgi:hypothetical protein
LGMFAEKLIAEIANCCGKMIDIVRNYAYLFYITLKYIYFPSIARGQVIRISFIT